MKDATPHRALTPRRLNALSDEELLDVRLCDLPVRIEGTWLADKIVRLYAELEARGLVVKPHTWLGEEWFTPDGVPGIALPFYLAHPRLMRLERRMMLHVEGGTDVSCMRILRHEAGHAIDNAYRLHFKRRWREHFGPYSKRYPDSYRPKPNSRSFVLHLPGWYAQAHPAEDFAETFAVWLTPGSRWRRSYEGWPAFDKLEFVDSLMREIDRSPPVNRRRLRVESLAEHKSTLRQHYERKRRYYAFESPAHFDGDLQQIFCSADAMPLAATAVSFLRHVHKEAVKLVAQSTAVHPYTVNHIFEDMVARSKQLRLRVCGRQRDVRSKVIAALTTHTISAVHAGYHRLAL